MADNVSTIEHEIFYEIKYSKLTAFVAYKNIFWYHVIFRKSLKLSIYIHFFNILLFYLHLPSLKIQQIYLELINRCSFIAILFEHICYPTFKNPA